MLNRKKFSTLIIVSIVGSTLVGCSNKVLFKEKENITKNISENNEKDKENNTYNPMLMLVNDKYWLEKDFIPDNLEIVNISFSGAASQEERQMEFEAAKALEKLFQGALDEGIYLYGVSGYRSYKLQQHIYDVNLSNHGQDYTDSYIAIPGRSEHQTGLSMDIGDASGNLIENEKQIEWIRDNSHKYGFIVRYPKGKEDITGYSYEPWHIRYVGDKAAKEIYNKDITLEEYYEY